VRLVDDVLRVVESGQVGAGRLDAVSWFVVVFGWVWWHGHGPDLHSGQGPGLVWRAPAGAAVDYVYLASTRAQPGGSFCWFDSAWSSPAGVRRLTRMGQVLPCDLPRLVIGALSGIRHVCHGELLD